ncbi:(2Fe-2S)-binding protein [Sporomusa sphaeroides]|uniref:Hydrogen cyanide synthase subunit HcnB n=2 Tax=Sporomusa TaxID=2375 RepID=A0ABP2C929_9FIRM|nr:(2Fe-2S)-binding protein [Sporomusa sphaeroides]OLS58621.1 hydrogen cyanide synthase subunit HcnB [Sporomusa sphaeroides DSM 2875]CVK19869.1 Hydrogen cyanide synthase subunit HcnB [Sporomusa sphaeroides DSM 2875]SCM79996.1 BFD domain protein (2Fe-2S)-binding domain protein [uncultured Sporomusa sp.]
MSEPVIICRCEDITLKEIQELITQGAHTLEELKRECRCGMGPCQGRTCMPLIARELAATLKTSIADIAVPVCRPPTAPISLGALALGDDHD